MCLDVRCQDPCRRVRRSPPDVSCVYDRHVDVSNGELARNRAADDPRPHDENVHRHVSIIAPGDGPVWQRDCCLGGHVGKAEDSVELEGDHEAHGQRIFADHAFDLGAQQAYYFFFALFPALLTLLSIASFFTIANLIDEMVRMIGEFVPPTC